MITWFLRNYLYERIFVRRVGGSIIKDVTIKVAAERDSEFVQELQSLGVNRNVARVITFLKDQNERAFIDIEIATDLKKQKVSNAMQPLKERGWLNEQYIKSNGRGKGRPLKIYVLRVTIDEIINYYEAEKSREYARASEAIQRLKELSST
jgi:predicted transcriptional regulator